MSPSISQGWPLTKWEENNNNKQINDNIFDNGANMGD